MGRTALLRVRLRESFVIVAFTLSFTSFLERSAFAQPSPVQWTKLVNATATGSALQKTAGCNGCADAGAISVQRLDQQDGFVEFVPASGFRLYAGLGSNTTSNTDPALIDFAFSFWPDGGWDIRERNVYRTEGRFVPGDVFRIDVTSGVVTYYQNGALVYTSLVQPAAILALDTTLNSGGAMLMSAITSAPTPPPPTPVSIVTTTLPDGVLGQNYAATLQASGGNGSFQWSITGGALPDGVTMTGTGLLAGTPISWGVAQFVARATDSGEETNYAERTLSITVPAPLNPVSIQTATLPSTRLAQSYSADVAASGGTGSLVWTIVSGTLPQGITLESSTGVLHGTATTSGRFSISVQVSDSSNELNRATRPLTLSVLAETPPSRYSALTDRLTRAKGPLPTPGPAGSTFTDPLFGSTITRITDGGLRPAVAGWSYRTPSSVHSNAWSADERYFYAVSTDGVIVPFSFDRTSGRASRLQPVATGDGGLTLRFFNEPTFSYTVPGIAYGTFNGSGANLRSVDQYDFETDQYLQLLNLDTLAPNLAGTYTGGLGVSAGPVERLFAFFGGTSQDRHFYLVVFDRNNPANRHLLDTVASTLDGIPTGTLLNFKIHAVNIDRSGRFVVIYPTGADLQAPRSAAPVYVWDLETGTFTALPLIQAITGGHDAFGYGDRVNQDCCTTNINEWDAAQWQYRSLSTPFSTVDLIVPILRPEEVYLADHPSWHNAQPDRLVPFLESNYRYGANTTQWRPWDEEIIAIQTEGAGSGATVWRFAHHRSAVASDVDPSWIYFWYTPRVNISPDGQWALFTSNWEKTLGTDPRGEVGGSYRQDVFLISLKPAPAVVPVDIVTTTLPSGTATLPYSATLQASGGTGSYVWSISAGSVPAGLSLSTTGVISGTPTTAASTTFTVRATDAAASGYADQVLTITIALQSPSPVAITTTTLPDGYRNSAYSIAIATSGGKLPFQWSITKGSLPPGVSLNTTTGTISGTPTQVGNWSFTIRVVDSASPATTASRSFSIRIRQRK